MSCKNCGSDNVIFDKHCAQMVCTSCGLVLEESMIDEGAEWLYNVDDNGSRDPSRCGAPTMEFFEKSSMSTRIGGKGNFFMKKIHNQMSMDYVERSRYHVFNLIERWGVQNGKLSQNVINQAKSYYVILSKKKISRGNVRKGLIACCIMYGCKSCGVSRSIKEISQMCDVETSVINKAEKKFEELMKDDIKFDTVSTNVGDLVLRFLNKLNFDSKMQYNLRNRIMMNYEKINEEPIFIGKTPSAITSGLVSYQLGLENIKIDKKELAQTYEVSNVTLNKITNMIKEVLVS